MRVDNVTLRRARLLSSEFVRAGHAASNVHGLGTLVQRLLEGPVRKKTCAFSQLARRELWWYGARGRYTLP